MRTPKELLQATRPFAHEQPWLSWWHLGSTLLVLVVLLGSATLDLPWIVRIACSIGGGLTLVRMFIVFHDQQHGAIFRHSRLANALMLAFGLFTLNPTSVWRRSHDHHHRHNSKDLSPNIGSFPLMTVEGYQDATWVQRLAYRISRHPLTLLLGYFTVFGGSMCVFPLLRNPRRHFDAALSIICHCGLALLLFRQWDDFVLAWLLPFIVGSGLGAYLFFAQHNFPGVRLQLNGQWNYVFSAMHSSSYIAMNPLMSWFTGNIGYHHVHHLNAKIPFYRLPEAMAAIEELQSPTTTSLSPWQVLACLRLKLWDPVADELVPWPKKPVSLPLPKVVLPLSAATIGEPQA